MTRFFILLFVAGLLAGCGTRRESGVAHALKNPDGKWEIRLDAREWVAGGPCNITFPKRIHISHWIYADKIEGEVPAARLTLAYEQGTNNIQEALRGTITFSNDNMHVDLKIPYFKDGVSVHHFERYELNGDYKLETK